ncbi:pyruvate dehydrogenase E2 component (dihydrolipoamide acetyltransferase) [Natronoarchaeum philippinense]|uniref:Pyruvate dehydrogenase E2 component (Dihydrolipoamide acetyltransferase) n=1 Tax=Natronoarchaeum philippinense TaxID=558529 RepID=A0A285P3R8_NATPI|nr:dihydrolipoamide acetyltransferase family protein [Natronoarchaeum philippinense]SNZ15803.1 pyruvate dehydrogenase E2 component (dihydrolipoamide acetyltransferase) [Natronoarchaeum philippinense]
MVREFKLPDVGEGVAEGEIVRWAVEPGDAVTEDQPVAEVETDKAVVDVPAPVDGTVKELLAEEGEIVPVGDVIVTFDTDEEGEPESDAQMETDADAETAADAEAETASDADTAASGRVFAPPSVRRLAREEGVDLGAIEGTGPGGRITAGDVDAAASGDAGAAASGGADARADAAASSTAPDAEAAVDAEMQSQESTGGAEAPSQEATPVAETGRETARTDAADAADRDRTLAAPATRRVAREEGVDLDAVPATEERDGEAFVTEQAVREYAATQREAQTAETASLQADTGAAADTAVAGERERRRPYRGVRRTIGERMSDAKFSAPHVTHHDTADATELVELRERLAPEADERGIRLTYTPLVMKAVVAALKQHPIVNAQLDEDAEEIVEKRYYNVGVAADTEAGLMVPVVDDVDGKGLLQVASETNELVQKARERSIEPSELRGGTFTITNVGAIGGEYATPIINRPQVAILALGAIEQRPVVEDGEVVARHTLPLSLSIDHRVVDGADAARFTNTLMEYLEEPSLLLLE